MVSKVRLLGNEKPHDEDCGNLRHSRLQNLRRTYSSQKGNSPGETERYTSYVIDTRFGMS